MEDLLKYNFLYCYQTCQNFYFSDGFFLTFFEGLFEEEDLKVLFLNKD